MITAEFPVTNAGWRETPAEVASVVDEYLSVQIVREWVELAESWSGRDPGIVPSSALDLLAAEQGIEEPTDLRGLDALPRSPVEDDFLELLQRHRNNQSAWTA